MVIAVSINKKNLTHEYITESKVFTVSILSTDTPMTLIGKFGFKSGRDIDKFADTDYKVGETGAPVVLDSTLAYLEARVLNSMDVGTHTIFTAEVVGGEVLNDIVPMTYEYYHQVKKGTAPKTAPTYLKEGNEEMEQSDKKSAGGKYRCTVCGYIYDPAVGDPDSGIMPGTSFGEIPGDWVCPICGASKPEFEPIKE